MANVRAHQVSEFQSQAAVRQLYGLFMITWSVLESAIQTAIVRELGAGVPKGVAVTAGMQFRQRISVLSGLLRLNCASHSEAVALLSRIEGKAKRNLLVHGHVIVGVPGQLTFVKASLNETHGLRAKKARFTEAQLQHHIVELNDEIKRLQLLLNLSDEAMQSVADESLCVASSDL